MGFRSGSTRPRATISSIWRPAVSFIAVFISVRGLGLAAHGSWLHQTVGEGFSLTIRIRIRILIVNENLGSNIATLAPTEFGPDAISEVKRRG